MAVESIKLKESQYYIEEFKDFKSFRTKFAHTREIYLKLGQHHYPQIDHTRPLTIKRGQFEDKDIWIYIGQVDDKTKEPDGVGIEVWSDGVILEGCWKNGNQSGFGRYINPTGEYYIGEFEEGEANGDGTEFNANGSVKNSGVWKDSNPIQDKNPL